MLAKNCKAAILFWTLLFLSTQTITSNAVSPITAEIASLHTKNPSIKQWYSIEDSFFRSILTYTDNINLAFIKKDLLSYLFFAIYPMTPLLFSEDGSLLYLPPQETPQLNAILDKLCAQLDIKRPAVYLLTNQTYYNFFTVSFTPNNAALVLSNTLLDILSEDELTVALAHELSHIKSYDSLKKSAISISQLFLIGATAIWFIMGEKIQLKESQKKYFIALVFVFIITIWADLFFTQQSEIQADKNAIALTQKDECYAGMVTKIEQYQKQQQLNDYYYLGLRLKEFKQQYPIHARILQTITYIYQKIKLFSLSSVSAYANDQPEADSLIPNTSASE